MPLLLEPFGDGYTILREDPQVFKAIYIGCRASDEDVEKIVNHVETHLPNTKLYKAAQSRSAFELIFEEVIS